CSGGFTEQRAAAQDTKPNDADAIDSSSGSKGGFGDKALSDQPGKPLNRVPYLSKLFLNGAGEGTGSADDRDYGAGGSEAGPPDADRLTEQLRRLEQQNEETRRALRRLEEQLKATQKMP